MSSQSQHEAVLLVGTGFGVIAATAIAAVVSISFVFISGSPVGATEPAMTSASKARPGVADPSAIAGVDRNPAIRPDVSATQPPSHYPPLQLPRLEPRRLLGPADEIAALEAVQIALSEVGDGSSYVWHRDHGRLSGVVKPTASYLDDKGQICRHLHILLTSGDYAKRAEGVACRDTQGIWSLEG